MTNRFLLASLVSAVAASTAGAQTAAPPPDKAAMERALQQADGPRRRILEAARLKAGTPPATAPAPAAPAPVAGAAPRPRPDTAEKAADKTPEGEIVTVVTLPAGIEPVALPASASVAGVAVLAPAETVPPPAAALADLPPPPAAPAAAPPAALALQGLPPPRLVTMVEPELPARLFRRGTTRTEIVVDLVINVDGTVRSAVVRSSSNNEIEAAVLEAVNRWRYEQQPAVRTHVVRLVVTPS